MRFDSQSLLTFLDSPVVVGDPEGRAVYANPAFLTKFSPSRERIAGMALSEFFEGGGREAVLAGVAQVCSSGRTIRFRARERGVGYACLASPITSEGLHVGVLILLTEEAVGEERLLAFHREIQDPLEDLDHCLTALVEQTGGRRDERYRVLLEDGLRAHARLRKWSADLHALLSGFEADVDADASLDPVRTVRSAAASVRREFDAAGASLELLVPAQLPRAKGDADRFESALLRLLRDRIAVAKKGAALTLTAKVVGEGEARCVLVSLIEPAGEGGEASSAVREIVAACGGSVETTEDPVVGRMTAIRLPVAA